jgi:hypothetical protein
VKALGQESGVPLNAVCGIIGLYVFQKFYKSLTKLLHCTVEVKKIDEAVPLTGHAGPKGCETSRLPYFLHNRLTEGGEVVSFARRPPFTPRNIPDTHFCYRMSRLQGHSAARRMRSFEKSIDLIGNRNRDLLACSTVPQPITLPRAPHCTVL